MRHAVPALSPVGLRSRRIDALGDMTRWKTQWLVFAFVPGVLEARLVSCAAMMILVIGRLLREEARLAGI